MSLTVVIIGQAFLCTLVTVTGFYIKDDKVFDDDGNWIVFRGIGLTCTEYMMKPGIDDGSPYPGYWAYNSCFGGVSSSDGTLSLNKEPSNVLNYLSGDNFSLTPKITKIKFDEPYSQVIDSSSSPNFHPIIRIPITGSCYLYDNEVTTGNSDDYANAIDLIVNYFTLNKIAVIIDQHWCCPDSTTISNCQYDQTASMALYKYGDESKGSIDLWDTISKRYSNNSYVFYELFNEPYVANFDEWYNGQAASTSNNYAGMREMYDTIRKNDKSGIIVIGGANGYALDAQTPIAMALQYPKDNGGTNLTNVMWNSHPYQGAGQYLEHSLNSEMRFTLALKLVGPVQ